MTKKTDKQAAVYELTQQIVAEWSENAEQEIRKRVTNILDHRVEELVLVLCGLEKNYHYGWRADHCNGRGGNSPLMEWIKDACSDFLSVASKGVALTEKERSDINAAAKDIYLSEYRSRMLRHAKDLARDHADEFVKREVGDALNGAAESVRLRLMDR